MSIIAIARRILSQLRPKNLHNARKARRIVSHHMQVNADVYGIYIAGHPSRMSFANTIFPSVITQIIFGYLSERSELYVPGPLFREYRTEYEWSARCKVCRCDVTMTNSIMLSGWDCDYCNIENVRDRQKVIMLNCVANITDSDILDFTV